MDRAKMPGRLIRVHPLRKSYANMPLAVEACLRAYARKFGADEEQWGIVGLIHDFDYEKYPSAEEHPYKGNEILKERGYPDDIRRAIMSHADYTGVTRDSMLEKTLFACDELAGFITATALINQTSRWRKWTPIGAKADEGQSLRALRQPRRHRQWRRRTRARSRRAHHLLHRSDEINCPRIGSGRNEYSIRRSDPEKMNTSRGPLSVD